MFIIHTAKLLPALKEKNKILLSMLNHWGYNDMFALELYYISW